MKKHKHTLHKRCTAMLGRFARCAAALLLVFSMLLAVLPVFAQGESVLADSDIPEALSRAQLEEHGAVQRLYDEEQGDNDFVFLNRDGTITRYDFSVPVKYKDETGKYRDKNNKIKDWNGEYGNTAGDVELRFPKQLNFIKIKYNGHTVRIKPVTSASPGHLPAMVQGSSVSYAGAFGEGTELRYTATMSGIKEDIILQNSAQGNSFSFEVRTGGLELRQQYGVWGIYDGETAVFSFGDLEVTDSFTGQDEATDDWDAHRTYAQAQVSALGGDKYLFTITVPQEYLQAESTVYPVYVDPTFNVSRSYIQDTYIAKGYTNNYVNSSLVAVGYGTNAKNVRTLAKISDTLGGNSHDNIGSGYNINEVSSVKYSMYCTSDYSSSPVVDVYAIAPMTSWDPSTVTWSNGAEQTLNGATLISSLTVKGKGRYEFDIKTAYNSWAFLGMNSGVLFKMRTEVSGKYRQFASANSSNSQQLPYIIVTYGKPVTMIISATNITLPIGGTTRLAASVFPQDIDTAINWESLDDSVATVDDNGVVRAVGVGEVSIIARSQYDPSVSVQCGVTVKHTLNRITFIDNQHIADINESVNFPYSITPVGAYTGGLRWGSSNDDVADVDINGVVTTHAYGSTVISVNDISGNCKASYMLYVAPSKFTKLKKLSYITNSEYMGTDDGFFLSTKSVGDILHRNGITAFKGNNNDDLPVTSYLDDWYIFAINYNGESDYGLLKLREQESDADSNADGDEPGVTVSFISFDIDAMFNCIANPTAENKKLLWEDVIKYTVESKENLVHSNTITGYFADPTKDAAYLIAEQYCSLIARLSNDGSNHIAAPDAFNALEHSRKSRLNNGLADINQAAGRTVFDAENKRLQLVNSYNNLDKFERQAILTTHTANVNINSFAAEIVFHADKTIEFSEHKNSKAYLAAVRADMTVSARSFYDLTGITEPYYNLDSDYVKKQVQYHGER